jgi:hypothetical protein
MAHNVLHKTKGRSAFSGGGSFSFAPCLISFGTTDIR